jgi:protein-S-isoprenylcysteine O-methyltransferase Ste14
MHRDAGAPGADRRRPGASTRRGAARRAALADARRTPLEAIAIGGEEVGRLVGALLFAAGVALYRTAGRSLGAALSPFVGPRAGSGLVTGGLYRYVRHPIYVSEAMIAVGAPLTLGSRYVLWLAVPAVAVLVLRVVREEAALARTFPNYACYAARTKRIVPFLY